MSANTNQFLVSVADVVVRDTVADQVVLKGKTLISSALKQSVNNQEVRGGFGDGLLYTYSFQKKLDVSIEDAKFDETYIALNNGVNITSETKNYMIQDEVVVLASGAGSLSQTPIGNIYVQKPDNTIATIAPTGKTFTVSGLANETVKVNYFANTTVDSILIDATHYPNAYELTMTAKLFQAQGQTAEVQIVVPQFKPNGTFDLNFTAQGVSTSKLDGSALVNPSDSAYAYIYIRPIGTNAAPLQAIAVTPGAVTLTSSNSTAQLTVYGIRGGLYSNIVNPTGTTFSSSATSIATVNASGIVTRVAAGSAVITATNGSLTDTVAVTCS